MWPNGTGSSSPATAAAEQRRRTQAGAIRRKLAQIGTAETALITELETPADPADPAAQALRDLLADARADHNTPPASDPGTAPQDPVSHLTGDTG